MKPLQLLATIAVFIFFSISDKAFSDDVCHFRDVKVPPDEARILTLTGVREFRCDYEVPAEMPASDVHYNGSDKYPGFDLYAELYSGTTCKARYRFGFAVGEPKNPMKGSLSLGWNSEKHELRNVVDNGAYPWPFTTMITLKDISTLGCFFFENSKPEKRHTDGNDDFVLYPVAGIYPNVDRKFIEPVTTDTAAFLQRAKISGFDPVIIIYLYKTAGGEAPLLFNPSP